MDSITEIKILSAQIKQCNELIESTKDTDGKIKEQLEKLTKELIEKSSNSQPIPPAKVITLPSSSDSMKVVVSPDT